MFEKFTEGAIKVPSSEQTVDFQRSGVKISLDIPKLWTCPEDAGASLVDGPARWHPHTIHVGTLRL